MKEILLKSRIRKDSGKKNSHVLRKEGEIPGVLYGHKKDPVNLAVPQHDFWHILHNSTTEHLILKIELEGEEAGGILTLVRDVQHHPVSGDILHVDFQRIMADEGIKVGVPVTLVGMARGVKEFGGILDHGVREVKVATTPADVPEALEVDVSEMEIGQSLHISDLRKLYPSLDFLDDDNVTLAHVSPPKKLEVAETAEVEEAAVEAPEGEAAEGDES